MTPFQEELKDEHEVVFDCFEIEQQGPVEKIIVKKIMVKKKFSKLMLLEKNMVKFYYYFFFHQNYSKKPI